MSRVSLATVLLISMLLWGCFGAPIAEWGSGNGEFETKWDNSPETLFNVTSKISEGTAQMDLNLQGCDDAGGEIKPVDSNGNISEEPLSLPTWVQTDGEPVIVSPAILEWHTEQLLVRGAKNVPWA